MRYTKLILGVAICMVAFGIGQSIEAQTTYEVTITNLTRGQVITPPVVLSHGSGYALFTEGKKARIQLATLAESGATDPLVMKLQGTSAVFDVVAGGNVILPGDSVTLELMADSTMMYISAVGMLAQTNDGFFGLNGAMLPMEGRQVYYASAYDAGSEANNEDADFIPGPPFGGSKRATKNAEKYVHIHSGIHGIADQEPAMYDWRNPVVKITVIVKN